MRYITLKTISLILLLNCVSSTLYGQSSATNSGGQVVTVQPKIMVIPYTTKGQDIRTILESDFNLRIAVTKIKEAFDSRGFTTVDFTARLKATNFDPQTTARNQIINQSGADIYVEVEVHVQKGQSGNSVTLLLTAYEVSTGNSLSNKEGESGRFYTEDIGKLASRAVESIADDFLNVLQMKFTEIVNNGKSVKIDIGFKPGSQYTMSSEIGEDGWFLSDHIEMWMENNAFKNNYHIEVTTDLQMIFDDVRIPLKNQTTGQNYNPNQFAREMRQFLRKLGLSVNEDINGNTIYVTIE